jgi:hypothetical protein
VWLSLIFFPHHHQSMFANLGLAVTIIVPCPSSSEDVSPCPLVRQAAYSMRLSNGCMGMGTVWA